VVDGWTRLEYHSFDAYNEAMKLWNASGSAKSIIQVGFWQTKSTATARISVIAKHMAFGSLLLLLVAPRKAKSETKHKITGMNANE
jgi:hypothetical protein